MITGYEQHAFFDYGYAEIIAPGQHQCELYVAQPNTQSLNQISVTGELKKQKQASMVRPHLNNDILYLYFTYWETQTEECQVYEVSVIRSMLIGQV